MTQRRAINDDGSPETPDRDPWDAAAVDEGAAEAEALDAGGWIPDAARLRAPGEEDGPEEALAEETFPEEGASGPSQEEEAPVVPVDDGGADEPEPAPASEETGGGEESSDGDTPPEELGGAGSEAPAARRTAFVEAIVTDPANPPAVRLLAGYAGAAADPGKTRLYLDLALGAWIDLPAGDVLHAVKAGPGRLEKTLVWVRASSPALSGAAGGEEGTEMRDEGPFHAP